LETPWGAALDADPSLNPVLPQDDAGPFAWCPLLPNPRPGLILSDVPPLIFGCRRPTSVAIIATPVSISTDRAKAVGKPFWNENLVPFGGTERHSDMPAKARGTPSYPPRHRISNPLSRAAAWLGQKVGSRSEDRELPICSLMRSDCPAQNERQSHVAVTRFP